MSTLPTSSSSSPVKNPTFVGTFWAFIASLLTLLAGGYTISQYAYNQGKDNGAAELAVFKAAEKLDLEGLAKNAAQTTSDLKNAAAVLNSALSTNLEYINAKAELDKFKVANQKLYEEKRALENDNSSLRSTLQDVQAELIKIKTLGQSYTVGVGSSAIVMVGRLNFGVKNVDSTGVANVIINGVPRQTVSGDRFEIKGDDGSKCVFNTRSVDYYTAPEKVSVDVDCEVTRF